MIPNLHVRSLCSSVTQKPFRNLNQVSAYQSICISNPSRTSKPHNHNLPCEILPHKPPLIPTDLTLGQKFRPQIITERNLFRRFLPFFFFFSFGVLSACESAAVWRKGEDRWRGTRDRHFDLRFDGDRERFEHEAVSGAETNAGGGVVDLGDGEVREFLMSPTRRLMETFGAW